MIIFGPSGEKKSGRNPLRCILRATWVFRPVLDPLLDGMHAGTKHLGKVPAGSASRIKFEKSVVNLRGELKEAVEKEDFEKAAKLRDQLRDLESKTNAKA